MRCSCSGPRSSSCLSARQASGGKPVVRLTPQSGATVPDVLQLLAPTEKQLRGLSPPCFPFLKRRTSAGLRSSFLSPSSARPPTVTLTWLLLLLCRSPPGTDLSLACIMPPSLLLARLEHAQSTSLICSMSRVGFMLTRSMLRFLSCSAGSPQAPCLLLLDGSLGHGSAGNARRTASRVPSRWVSSFALPTLSVW